MLFRSAAFNFACFSASRVDRRVGSVEFGGVWIGVDGVGIGGVGIVGVMFVSCGLEEFGMLELLSGISSNSKSSFSM